eukprot:scaffold4013_cov192-Ochromonas_danica.AAC.2
MGDKKQLLDDYSTHTSEGGDEANAIIKRNGDNFFPEGLHERRSSSFSTIAHPPDPPDAVGRPSVLKTVTGFILITEFCERIAYYGFAGSLVLFFENSFGYSNADADVQYSAWSGICYVTPLLGGYLADTYLGRYKTILIFCSIYLLGLALVVVSAEPDNLSIDVLFPAIYIIALGTGGIKPNVSTMGADQFNIRYSQDRKELASFFNWFYWSINLGSLIAYTLVAYICQYGLPFLGGERWGFFVGYLIPLIMMAMGIFVFLLGSKRYKAEGKPQGSAVAEVLKIVYEAVWIRRGQPTDRAKSSHAGSHSNNQVDRSKLVIRLFPFLAVMIPFWTIYSTMSTTFQNQGCQMDLSLGGGLQVPVAALNCFDTLAILLLVPVFDQYIYVYLKNKGYELSMLQKIGWGFFFALLGVVVAGGVEIGRKAYSPPAGNYYDTSARDNITPCQSIDDFNPYNYQSWSSNSTSGVDKPANCWQTCDDQVVDPSTGATMLSLSCIQCDDIPQMSHMSVFWQIFQFALIGTSEILASITSLEFFYSQAPLSMRSVSQACNLLTTAIGSLLTIPLIYVVNANPNDEWVPSNLDQGHLEYYFFVLTALMVADILALTYVARDYTYIDPRVLASLEGEGEDGLDANGESVAHPVTMLGSVEDDVAAIHSLHGEEELAKHRHHHHHHDQHRAEGANPLHDA